MKNSGNQEYADLSYSIEFVSDDFLDGFNQPSFDTSLLSFDDVDVAVNIEA